MIAAVLVPVQEVKEHTVILQVVEARFGKLTIQDHKFFKKERLYYYWKIGSGEILRYGRLSKSVQMMNKNPDRRVKANLRAGKKPGTTDVFLSATTHFPVHLFSTFDREGAIATGRSRQGYGLRHNNFFGFDDILLSGYTFGRDFSGLYTYHLLPVSPQGASLLYGFSRSTSIPTKEFTKDGIKSTAKNVTLSLRQDLYKKDSYWGEIFLGFDAKDKTTWINTGTFSRDRLRIFTTGAHFITRGFKSNSSHSMEYSQGVDAFGASSQGNPLASRGAKSNFAKFNVASRYKRILPLDMEMNLKFKTQISSTKLVSQETFNLGGIDSVRGYPSGDYLADNAVSGSLELLVPAFFLPQNWRLPYAENYIRNQITPLAFLDYGWGMRRGALPTEKRSMNLVSVGTGIRLSLFNQAVLRLEWGFPLAGNRPVTETARSRFHFSIDFQDKLPEEIERIRKLIQEENIKQWAWQLVNEALRKKESPLARKLYSYLYLARQTHSRGRIEESKRLYQKMHDICISLYGQAEDYVRRCLEDERELQGLRRLAFKNYQEGNLSQAKELWQGIINEATFEQLVLEF